MTKRDLKRIYKQETGHYPNDLSELDVAGTEEFQIIDHLEYVEWLEELYINLKKETDRL